MKISAAIMKAMSAAGCSAEQIIAAVEAAEREAFEKAALKREQGRERQRRYRERNAGDALHGVTERHEASRPLPDKEKSPTPPKEINPTPNPSSLRSEERAPAKPKTVKPFRMPDDFFPDIDFAVSEGMTRSQAEAEAERMRDWSKSSKNGAKLDWPATWRGWVRRRLEESPPQRNQPQPRMTAHQQRHQTAIDAIDRKLGLKRNDEPTLYDFDLEPADWRSH